MRWIAACTARYGTRQSLIVGAMLGRLFKNTVRSRTDHKVERLAPVGTRTGVNGVFGSSNNIGEWKFSHSRTRHVLPFGAEDLQIVYAGFHVDGNSPEKIAMPRCFQIEGVEIVSGGHGYVVGDVIPVYADQCVSHGRLVVIGEQGGVVTQISAADGGIYTEVAPDPYRPPAVNGGHGIVLRLRWQGYAFGVKVGVEPRWEGLKESGKRERFPRGGYLPAEMTMVPLAGLARSPLVRVDAPPGSAIGVRYSGTYGGLGRMSISGLDQCDGYNYLLDRSTEGRMDISAAAAGYQQPLCILGRPVRAGLPSVVIFGDGISIASTGTGRDPADSDGNIGWIERALGSCVPWSNFACDGDGLGHWCGEHGYRAMRMKAIKECGFNTAVLALGVNDFSFGRSVDDIIEMDRMLARDLRAAGVETLVASTTTPITASTDGWATYGGQTPSAVSPAIDRRNDLMRSGKHPAEYAAVIDCAAACGRGPLWRPGMTTEGYHPNERAHQAMMAEARAVLGRLWPEVKMSGRRNPLLHTLGALRWSARSRA